MVDERPNPDELLQRIQRQEEKARRGRLKVFFGAAAGVGKTYAMLLEAQELRAQGVDVVVGLVETHGRADAVMLAVALVISRASSDLCRWPHDRAGARQSARKCS